MTKRLLILLAFAASVALIQTGCDEDACASKDCGFGLCLEDGTCDCDPGYEFDANGACSTLSITKWLGEFRVVDDSLCSSDATPYIVTVTGNGIDTLSFQNIYASGGSVAATFVGVDVVIARQLLGTEQEISGSGTIDATTGDILMNYYLYDIDDPTAWGVCENALFTKQ